MVGLAADEFILAPSSGIVVTTTAKFCFAVLTLSLGNIAFVQADDKFFNFEAGGSGVKTEVRLTTGDASAKLKPKLQLKFLNSNKEAIWLRVAEDHAESFRVVIFNLDEGTMLTDMPLVKIPVDHAETMRIKQIVLESAQDAVFDLRLQDVLSEGLKKDANYRVYINFNVSFLYKTAKSDWLKFDGKQIGFESVLVRE